MSLARRVLPGESIVAWQPWGTYTDILVDRCDEGIARIAINRPAKRNAFRPQTVVELCDAFSRVRDEREIGVVLFTGAGPTPVNSTTPIERSSRMRLKASQSSTTV